VIAHKELFWKVLHQMKCQFLLESCRGLFSDYVFFLFYVNDIAVGLSSTVRLFADDTMLYLTVQNNKDAVLSQHDLDKLCQWQELG